MQAKQFVDQLEAQGLLAPEIVEELRRQVEESKSRITPAALARLLVENGHLTKFQATKLVSDLNKDAPGKALPKQRATGANDDDLGLAPEAGGPNEANRAIIVDEDEQVTDVEIVD